MNPGQECKNDKNKSNDKLNPIHVHENWSYKEKYGSGYLQTTDDDNNPFHWILLDFCNVLLYNLYQNKEELNPISETVSRKSLKQKSQIMSTESLLPISEAAYRISFATHFPLSGRIK